MKSTEEDDDDEEEEETRIEDVGFPIRLTQFPQIKLYMVCFQFFIYH